MLKQAFFTLSGSADDYPGTPITFDHPVRKLSVIVNQYVADSAVEVDVRVPGETSWYTAMASATAAGIYEIADFLEPEIEVRIRVKDGGTSGTAKVIAIATRDRRV